MTKIVTIVCALMVFGVAIAQDLVPTPGDAVGPFYPDLLPSDQDHDLVRIAGRSGRAEGREFELRGRVVDVRGHPQSGVRIELWQTDARGRYIHSGDPSPSGRDPLFQGFGVAVSDAAGRYRFRTVEPGGYSSRPPHLHVRLLRGDRELLVTQLYLPGRSGEGWLSARGAAMRERLQTLREVRSDAGVDVAEFDFVLAVSN